MGLSQLEAGLLSAEVGTDKISQPLRHPVECGGSELHFSPAGERDDASEVAGADSTGVSLHDQGAPGHHAHQAAEGHGRFRSTFSDRKSTRLNSSHMSIS